MTLPVAPYALLAELTHRCPLGCADLVDTLQLRHQDEELTSDEWRDVLWQAAELGVVQMHLSGGEPLLRRDLEDVVRCARGLGIYTQLVTSGIGLTTDRAVGLAARGLNSVQLSVQAAGPRLSDTLAGRKAHQEKGKAACAVHKARLPLGLNVVLHRYNLDELTAIIDLALAWGADRLELANAQYYSWALVNRASLLPSRDQLDRAFAVYQDRKAALHGRMEMTWVLSDYHQDIPSRAWAVGGTYP